MKNVLTQKIKIGTIIVALIILLIMICAGCAANHTGGAEMTMETSSATMSPEFELLETNVETEATTATEPISSATTEPPDLMQILPEVISTSFVQETEPSKSFTTTSSWTPLDELPADYNREQAIADGVYIESYSGENYNQQLVDKFYEDVLAGGKAAFMRVMSFTLEGDPLIRDYQFDGENYTVTLDKTRDKYTSKKNRTISSETYKYLVPLDRSRAGRGIPKSYFLSNVENIYIDIITDDGKITTLINNLCSLPSPS